jgi:hypothetical protein
MGSNTLPHGAKGIDGENFVVHFGDDKIVFAPKAAGRGKHYTFHAGPKSGVMDVHETAIGADGREQHRTLFALRMEDVPLVLGELVAMPAEFLRLLRPLRLGWLKHRDIGIARGIDPVSDEDIAAVTRKRRRRLTLDAQRYEQNVYVPKYLEEVFDFPDGNFSLHHRDRKIGIGFKKTDGEGSVRLFWIKLRDLTHFGNAWQAKVAAALDRFGIPEDRYAEYPFLNP